MKKSLHKAIAVSAVCAAGLAGALTTNASAVAGESSAASSSAPRLTNFGYNANVFGTKVVIGGVELKTLRDANAAQPCTRLAGLSDVVGSIADVTKFLPIANELIHISPSTSEYQTYQDKALGVSGVKGINTIADIAIGGELVDDVKIPTIKIEGLQSIADSFYDAKANGGKGAFGHQESFGFGDISIDYSGTIVDGTPLADLLDIVNDTVAPITEVVDQLVQLLSTVGVIEIPGLGSIGLGSATGNAFDNSANAEAYALKIAVNPTEDGGDKTLLQLGRAHTRISRGVESGVFRSQMMGLDLFAGNEGDGESLLHMGGISQQSIPCEGTGTVDGKAKTVTKSINHTSILGIVPGLPSLIADLENIEYKYSGQQLSKGRAKSVVESNLGALNIPAIGLSITGITSKINLLKTPNRPVQTKVTSTVGDILLNGESILPEGFKVGDIVEFIDSITGQTNLITFGKTFRKNYHGVGVKAISVNLPGFGSLLDVGYAAGRIYPR